MSFELFFETKISNFRDLVGMGDLTCQSNILDDPNFMDVCIII